MDPNRKIAKNFTKKFKKKKTILIERLGFSSELTKNMSKHGGYYCTIDFGC